MRKMQTPSGMNNKLKAGFKNVSGKIFIGKL
jgi:hypothetical protein